MAAGSLYARNVDYDALKKLDFLFAGNFKARMTQPFLSVFAASFASSFVFIFACFLFGLSMWGAFLIPAVVAFRGFGLGLTSGYLYSVYSWKGFLYNLAVILPGAFVCSIAILAASLEGIRCSRTLARHRIPSNRERPMGNYFLRFGVALAWSCAAAFLDTAVSALWSGYFTFA
jgi:stage II sporulation protein M